MFMEPRSSRGPRLLQSSSELLLECDHGLEEAIKGEQASLPCGFLLCAPETATRKVRVNTEFAKKKARRRFFSAFYIYLQCFIKLEQANINTSTLQSVYLI